MDYEEYFERWNSVLFMPNPEAKETDIPVIGHTGDVGTFPCHQHKTCEGLIKATGPYPPRVCQHCGVDTKLEQEQLSTEERSPGGVILSGIRST